MDAFNFIHMFIDRQKTTMNNVNQVTNGKRTVLAGVSATRFAQVSFGINGGHTT